MDFELPEELGELGALTARILADHATDWSDRRAWQELARAGVLAACLPGELGFLAAHTVLREVGAAAAPVPVWEALCLGALPLARFGHEALADEVVEGRTLVTGALVEEHADPWDPQARAAGDVLSGTKTAVPLGIEARWLLVSARDDDGATGIWLVDAEAAGVAREAQAFGDGQPHAVVTLDGAPARRLGTADADVLGWVLDRALAGLASQQAGACAAVLRMTADHAARREQFGRPLATFQAVAQRLADAWIDTDAVELTALQAAWRLSEDLPARDQVAIAKFWAAEAGHRVLHAAHHLHGGIGVDRAYGLARWFGMSKRIEFTLGGATPQLLRLGTAMALEPA